MNSSKTIEKSCRQKLNGIVDEKRKLAEKDHKKAMCENEIKFYSKKALFSQPYFPSLFPLTMFRLFSCSPLI